MNIELNTSRLLARVNDGLGWLTLDNRRRRHAVWPQRWQGLADAAAEAGC